MAPASYSYTRRNQSCLVVIKNPTCVGSHFENPAVPVTDRKDSKAKTSVHVDFNFVFRPIRLGCVRNGKFGRFTRLLTEMALEVIEMGVVFDLTFHNGELSIATVLESRDSFDFVECTCTAYMSLYSLQVVCI